MGRERNSFRSYSDKVNILVSAETLVYPSIIHIRAEIFSYLLANKKDLIIDCSYLKVIDLTGINFFEELYKFQRKLGFNLVLSKVTDKSVLEIFHKLNKNSEFVLFDTNDDAVEFLRKLSIK